MLYIAYVTARPEGSDPGRLEKMSRGWWNDGARPPGLKTVGIYGCIGTSSPAVFVFDADSHDDIQTMVDYWRGIADLEIHPSVDLVEVFRRQGMQVA